MALHNARTSPIAARCTGIYARLAAPLTALTGERRRKTPKEKWRGYTDPSAS
jgi:hypothetical protein